MYRQFLKFNFCSTLFNRDHMMNLSMLHASTRGFNEQCIIDACTDIKLTSTAHTLIKPIEVIHFAMKLWNQETIKEQQNDQKFIDSKIPIKIKTLIRERLNKQAIYINHWNEAMAKGAQPENAYETSQILWQYADDSWYLAGDRSNDYNFYSKRILFLYAYTATELHLLTDKSKDFEQSWMFLDRRIDEILQMGSNILFLRQTLSTISSSGYYLATMLAQYPTTMNKQNEEKPKEQQKQE